MQCQALGMADLAPVVVDHPLSTLTDAEIDQRAEQALSNALPPGPANQPDSGNGRLSGGDGSVPGLALRAVGVYL